MHEHRITSMNQRFCIKVQNHHHMQITESEDWLENKKCYFTWVFVPPVMQWDYEGQITILLLKLHNSKWGARQCRNMQRQTTGVLYLFTASNSDSFFYRTSVLNCFCKRNFLTQSLSSYTIRQERHFLKQILCYALQIKRDSSLAKVPE